MKTSSAKAKGRRCAQETKELLLKSFPELQDDDILVTSSGVTGEDLVLSPLARAKFNASIECKAHEKLNIWQAYEQAQEHQVKRPDSIPIVFFKRNRSKLMVCLEAEDLFLLINRLPKKSR